MSGVRVAPLYTQTPLTNAGQQVLRAVLAQSGTTAADVARHCGTSQQGAGTWLTGLGTPSADFRIKLEAAPYCVDRTWWDMPPLTDAQPAAIDPPVSSYVEPDYNEPGIARKLLIEQVDRIRRYRHEQATRGFDAKTMAKLEAQETAILKTLGTATGELTRSDEAKLLRSNTWIRLRTAVVEALRQHPEALQAVIEVLRSGDAG